MRAWSGFALAASTATPTPGTDGSDSGGKAPSGRVTRVLLASSFAHTWLSVGSVGRGGRLASKVAVPTWTTTIEGEGLLSDAPPPQAVSATEPAAQKNNANRCSSVGELR